MWATDPDTDRTELKQVVQTFINETTELVHITVNDEVISCTPEHPFYCPTMGWTDACKLRAGDVLVTVNGEYVVVEKIQHELLEHPIFVYNFEVEDFHTYYASTINVLSHNVCDKTHSKLRSNMLKQGPAPGNNYQAHHGLPWVYREYFNKAGISVNDPQFGRWVKGGGNGGHQSWSKRYNGLWEKFIKNHETPVASDIIEYFNKLNGVR